MRIFRHDRRVSSVYPDASGSAIVAVRFDAGSFATPQNSTTSARLPGLLVIVLSHNPSWVVELESVEICVPIRLEKTTRGGGGSRWQSAESVRLELAVTLTGPILCLSAPHAGALMWQNVQNLFWVRKLFYRRPHLWLCNRRSLGYRANVITTSDFARANSFAKIPPAKRWLRDRDV